MRIRRRGIDVEVLLQATHTLEIIEQYPSDKYLPSYLVRGEVAGTIIHAQLATDVEGRNIRVVTMYRPDVKRWDLDFRIRRAR